MKACLVAGLIAGTLSAQVTFPSINSSPWLGQEMLGRVTDTSVTVNLVFDRDMQVYLEYGTVPGVYASKTQTQTAAANKPLEFPLDGLQSNTRHYYRVEYAPSGSSTFTARPERTFFTQRPRGSTFTFTIQADPHMDNNSSPDAYKLTMANQLADKPDFLIDLGDVMLADKLNADGIPGGGGSKTTAAGVLTRTQLLRSYYDLATHSIPLFQVMGNHEGEWGNNLDGTANNVAIWDTQYRNQYFPNPAPDHFFSGDPLFYDLQGNICTQGGPSSNCGLGQRRSYYAFEWGDALFVVLDPFWSQTAGVNTPGTSQDCCQKNAGYWSLTLGTAQYNWLKQTLEKSTATYKFVFSHNLVGGVEAAVGGGGPMRGGVEAAKYLEWGGYNLDGTWGFSTYRPNLPMPIHQLLVANRVTAYFHGHDHLYAHQSLDGIAYHEVPQPSATNSNLGTRAADYGYTQGTLLGGRGYLRVTVAPTAVTVQYVETWLPSEQKGALVNGIIADSYTLAPAGGAANAPSITSVGAAGGASAIAPNSWVEIKGANLAPSTSNRIWQSGDFAGNQLPTQLDGVSATVAGQAAYVYFVSPSQVNILTPPGALPSSAPVRITTGANTSAVFDAKGQAAAPTFFTFTGTNYVAAVHQDGSYVAPATLYPGKSSPAKPGEIILVYGNGFGKTTANVVPGSLVQSGSITPAPVVRVGNTVATVSFAGLVSPGLYQLNVVIPVDAADGDLTLAASAAGQSTPAGVLLTVSR